MTALPAANILDTVNGLPTHALLVHFTVVISTGGALAGLAYALVPRFRRWLSVPMLFVGAASIVLGIVTPNSGEQLERRVGADPLLEKHTQLGGQMGTIMIVFGAVLIITMLVARYRATASDAPGAPTPTAVDRIGAFRGEQLRGFSAQAPIAALLTALVLVGSVISGIWIYRTGDAGARSVWHDTPAPAAVAGDQH